MATIDIVYNRHIQFTGEVEEPTTPGEWQDAYDEAYTTGDFALADAWYDANAGRDSGDTLLDLGATQLTITNTYLNANNGNGHVTEDVSGNRWIVENIRCANIRMTSASRPLLIRQCEVIRQGASYLYCIHSPTSSPVHNVTIEKCTIDGEGKDSFAVYMPGNSYVDNDTVTRYSLITGFQSGVHGVYGNTSEYCLTTNTHYFEESHNTSASFRGGHSRFYRNRVRPGLTGSSGVNFYAEVSPGGDPEGYDFLYMLENMIHAPNADVTVQFPDEDDPSILYSDPFVGMTRICQGNIIDNRFGNPSNWTPPGGSIGSIFAGSGIADNIHWDLSEADDGSEP